MTKIEVNIDALEHNLRQLRQKVNQHHASSLVMAIIKANAYGHGALNVAHFLDQKVDYFGVARLDEALKLRKLGIQTPILVLGGFFSESELTQFVEYNIESVIHDDAQIKKLQNWQKENQENRSKLSVWVKVDTGMHRLGFDPEQIPSVFETLKTLPNIEKPLHLISHFANADQPENSLNQKQHQCFEAVIASLPKEILGKKTLVASSGLLTLPDAYYDMIRPGIALYGISPFTGKTSKMLGLRQVMTLKSHIIAIKSIQKGDAIGYGSIWTSTKMTQLGVIAIGYGDGYPREVAQNAPVLINGRFIPVVGRVSMDMLVVDLGANAQDKVGDEVILWGEELPIERIAELSKLSVYELVTRLTGRLEIDYVYDKDNHNCKNDKSFNEREEE